MQGLDANACAGEMVSVPEPSGEAVRLNGGDVTGVGSADVDTVTVWDGEASGALTTPEIAIFSLSLAEILAGTVMVTAEALPDTTGEATTDPLPEDCVESVTI